MVLIELAVPALLAWAATWFKRQREEMLNQRWYQILEKVVRDAVAAAEQLELTGAIEEFAESKLDYAIQYVERAMASQGIPLDIDPFVDVIRGMIEAEVRRQFPHEPDTA
jgi:hypothetical protein